jgi:hypothetical protein
MSVTGLGACLSNAAPTAVAPDGERYSDGLLGDALLREQVNMGRSRTLEGITAWEYFIAEEA